ncbi:hypothetical protein HKD37_02G006111 [Glycine soja]
MRSSFSSSSSSSSRSIATEDLEEEFLAGGTEESSDGWLPVEVFVGFLTEMRNLTYKLLRHILVYLLLFVVVRSKVAPSSMLAPPPAEDEVAWDMS